MIVYRNLFQKKIIKNFTFIALFLISFVLVVSAAPGGVDQSFGVNGKVLTDFANSSELINSVVIQPDGKIVAVGWSRIGSNPDTAFAIARYNANGSLDTSFGNGGKVTTVAPFGVNNNAARAVALQSDGKIVVVGTAQNDLNGGSIRKFGIARYNPDGSLDNTFGSGGAVVVQITAGDDAFDVAVQPDGKIVVVGSGNINEHYAIVIVRCNPDGSLDNGFGTGGKVITSSIDPNGSVSARAVKLQADGKIVIGGAVSVGNTSNTNILLARYNTDGSLDSTFGTGGLVTTAINFDSSISSIAIKADGKIIAGGYSRASDFVSALAQYNSNGTLDTNFGTNGIVTTTVGGGIRDLAIQPNGKIVTVGGVVARFNADGMLDKTFGTNGATGTNGVSLNSVALQSDGRIIGAGLVSMGLNNDFALNRFLVNTSNNFDFTNDRRADISVFRSSNGTWYRLTNSGFLNSTPFGTSGDLIAPADYDGDGRTDLAVFRPSNGTWYIQQSTGGFTGVVFGSNEDLPMPADFDGDGRSEIAVFRPSTGVWYQFNLVNNQTSAIAFGSNGDIPTASDYDGDGRADVAVFRPSNGTWYLNRSQLGFAGVQFGALGDKAIPSDYDGDGKTDLAVFRPSNGIWYLLQSTAGFTYIAFGQNGDLPAPADYDGDGKADIVVFRPSEGIWYLQYSTQDFSAIQFGTNGDKPAPNAFIP